MQVLLASDCKMRRGLQGRCWLVLWRLNQCSLETSRLACQCTSMGALTRLERWCLLQHQLQGDVCGHAANKLTAWHAWLLQKSPYTSKREGGTQAGGGGEGSGA